MYYIVMDFSYERSLGADCPDHIEDAVESFEEAEQILDSYDPSTASHCYIISDDEFKDFTNSKNLRSIYVQ